MFEHAVTRAGLRSTVPFQRRVACAYPVEPGSWTTHPDPDSWSFSGEFFLVNEILYYLHNKSISVSRVAGGYTGWHRLDTSLILLFEPPEKLSERITKSKGRIF